MYILLHILKKKIALFALVIGLMIPLRAQKGKLKISLELSKPVNAICVSSNDSFIAIADRAEYPLEYEDYAETFSIIIIAVSDYSIQREFIGHKAPIESVDFSFDNRYLLSTDQSGVIIVWELASGNRKLTLNTEAFVQKALFVSTSYDFLGIQGYDNRAFLYDIDGGLISRFNVGTQINDVEFSPISNQIYFGCYDQVQVWSIITRKKTASVPFTGLMCMAFNEDYTKLGIGSSSGEIRILSQNLTEDIVLEGHFKPVLSVDFNHDGDRLGSASSDQTARIWNLESHTQMLELTNEHKGMVTSIQFFDRKNRFVTGGASKELKFWE